jgi:hypothetical protein
VTFGLEALDRLGDQAFGNILALPVANLDPLARL